ncbi:MAG: hypothetical protein DRP79_05380 [Planctomycetota bacterium]|nr:MAG: hypothetical protein DRP79_05380 [Planctomycetota bacterium]
MNESEIGMLAGIIGGGVGALLGIDGVVISLMCSANFRKYRGFVSINLRVWVYLGLLGVSGGAVLLYGRYSQAVWYPCVLGGVILLVLGLMLRRVIDRKAHELEEKHSHPLDSHRR